MLFAQGRNPLQVASWLGHASPAVTLDVYAHLMDNDLGEALDLTAALAPVEDAAPTPLKIPASEPHTAAEPV